MRFGARLEKIEERAASFMRSQWLAITSPSPAESVVIASDEQTIALALERLALDPSPRATPDEIVLELRQGAATFAEAAATGTAREGCAFGTRGDGKTWTALATMLWHAKLHRDAGHPLPVRWLGITDTGRAHVLKTLPSALAPAWGGIWSVRDDSRLLVATVDGVELVHLILIGIEDQGALDRARMECHALWLEEPAPAGSMDGSSGVGLEAYLIASTSCRLPSHAHPKIISSNYPDVDHWTWVRFVEQSASGRLCIRIRPGERATEEQRGEWRETLKDRPDLMRRLLEGEPGVVALGVQVAVGFNRDVHVSKERLGPQHGGALVIGWDGGHQPSAIIGQKLGDGIIAVYASLTTHGGTLQLIEDSVAPWIAANAPWALKSSPGDRRILHYIDPSMRTGSQHDIRHSPVTVIKEKLGGYVYDGAVSWPGRREPMLAVLGKMNPQKGRAVLQLDPEACALLIQALSHRWYYRTNPATGAVTRDLPMKPNSPWADLGDAFAYFVGGVAGQRDPAERARLSEFYKRNPPKAGTSFNVYDYHRRPRR